VRIDPNSTCPGRNAAWERMPGRAAHMRAGFVRAVAVLAVLLTGGCGFKLAGPPELPFQTLYVTAPDYSSFGAEFRRYVESGGRTRLTTSPQQAEAVLEILSETREKQILSLTNAGRVAEYLLRYTVSFRVRNNENGEWVAPSEISLQRDLTYDNDAPLAKENEEQFLFQDMRNDAMEQLLHRLVAVQVPA
jgi:LPS-assembly lipoprotein